MRSYNIAMVWQPLFTVNVIITIVDGITNPGRYMFHAHVQEFTDLGWMGLFDVKQENATSAGTESRNL